MTTLELVRLLLALAVATLASATDLLHFLGLGGRLGGRLGPIPNRLLLPALLLVLGLLLLAPHLPPAVSGHWLEGPPSLPWELLLLLQVLGALAVGFGLWAAGLWAGGDGKLFVVLALALPPGLLAAPPPLYFPGWVLLFNSFLIFALLLPLELLLGLGRGLLTGSTRRPSAILAALRGHARALPGQWTKPGGLLATLATFLLAFLAFRLARSLVREELLRHLDLGAEALFMVLFFAFSGLKRLLHLGPVLLLPGLLLLALAGLWATGQLRVADLAWSAAFSVGLLVLAWLYELWLAGADVKDLPWQELRPGLIPSPACLEQFRLRERFYAAFLQDLAPDGLSPRQVEALKDWYARNEPQGTFQVSRTLPFAPALLIGLVITLVQGWAAAIR